MVIRLGYFSDSDAAYEEAKSPRGLEIPKEDLGAIGALGEVEPYLEVRSWVSPKGFGEVDTYLLSVFKALARDGRYEPSFGVIRRECLLGGNTLGKFLAGPYYQGEGTEGNRLRFFLNRLVQGGMVYKVGDGYSPVEYEET